ncbi:FUSC family protein [Rufibacter glacialis]|uniref:FUSC family protein n=1 Tax=Rufibacter glacialis TaxID=1259555 RepID=A0A5M8Q8F5_9BACT|nr:FUSC family protein [Rufibacter glacialis]KAA6431146.1 FUSC family protein [Rufibacter glacialis]GGK84408.1 FUSC family protein [Rufibacter glacialis]
MENTSSGWVRRELRSLVELKETQRLWHIALLAALCVGIPLLVGYYFDALPYGILACTGGLVILYLPLTSVAHRMVTLLVCSFGFMVSFTVGISFSFHPVLSSVVLGLFALTVHWVVNFFSLRPPGNFFFIMVATIASCMPFELETIPSRVGFVGLGTMLACGLAFFYSLYITRKHPPRRPIIVRKNTYTSLFEAVIIGVFVGGSLLVGHLLPVDNPYWIPISCAAVMQGVSLQHVWQRSFHRILGTFLGMGLAWGLLLLNLTPLRVCLSIMLLQFIIEILVVRNYGLAVVFITPLTILLAEAGSAMTALPNALILARMLDIFIGSMIGALGGWFLHHEQLRTKAERQIRKTRVGFLRR